MLVRRLSLLISLAALLTLAAPDARAQAGPKDGTLIAIDGADMVVDLGAARGVHIGDVVELWRPLRIRHPVTGQTIVDRFRIGALRLTQVRGALSIATVEGTPTRAPATGDVIIVPDDTPPPAALPPPKPKEPAPVTTTIVQQDPDAVALGKLMTTLAGADPEMRARSYETYARAHPESRFATVLHEEAEALRAKAKVRKEPRTETWSPRLDRVHVGQPQRFAVELDARFIGSVVHVRRKGAPGFRSLPMASAGPRYWAATLPGDVMTEDGMQYFVEGVEANGAATAIFGTAAEPVDVDAEPSPSPKRRVGLGQVSLQSEYASFNTKKQNDYVFQTEGTVGWRLDDVGMRAIRSGFGVLRGEGGSLQNLDTLNLPPDKVGLTYGYLEFEVAFSTNYAVVARPLLGLREEGITGGFAGFLRIGNDLRTNLLLGGEVLGGIGQRGIVELDWRTIKRVPIVLRSEVTNQPSTTGDVGVRAIAQVGYEFIPSLAVSLRGSYQGRTINHAGPGAGLAVSYQW